jgi:HD-like signal output (HDOD) protein
LLANISDYFETLDLVNAEAKLSFTSIEDHEYGVKHALIGAKLAHEQESPNEHRAAIAFHHERSATQSGGAVPIIATVMLSQYMYVDKSSK